MKKLPRMKIRNTSRYPDQEVARLVRLATKDVDMSGVAVHVKNSQHSFRGCAYNGVPRISSAPPGSRYLVTIGIGPQRKFPVAPHKRHRGAGSQFPLRPQLIDWRDALVLIAAHEAKHIEQFRERLKMSEVRCEHFAVHVLKQFQEGR